MYLLSFFYASNLVIALICILQTVLEVCTAVRYSDRREVLSCRISPFSLLLLAGYKISTCFLYTEDGVEIFSTQALTLLTACICVYTMASCLFMGRMHYRLVANWVLLLFPAVFFFFVNQLMIHYGYYRPLYSYSEIAEFRHSTPIIFFARATALFLLAVSALFALSMIIEAWVYDQWRLANRPSSDNTFPHKLSVRIIMYWSILLVIGYIPLFFSSLWLHILFNVCYVAILMMSIFVSKTGTEQLKAERSGEDTVEVIDARLPQLLNLEMESRTPWGVTVEHNPFFSTNPLPEEVAVALGVSNRTLQRYLIIHEYNLAIWVSEQRLLHGAQQVAETDRKIVEIATACGYNDLSAFSRAFKKKFDMTPSEYRHKELEKAANREKGGTMKTNRIL